jgi:four helix bundle protein
MYQQLRDTMGDYRQLKVWRRAHALTLTIYQETRTFPEPERYGLSQQLRRAALSVTSNIVEGCGRRTDREMARFLRIARGSLWELECQLLVARDLGMLAEPVWTALQAHADEVGRMMTGLGRRLSRPPVSD